MRFLPTFRVEIHDASGERIARTEFEAPTLTEAYDLAVERIRQTAGAAYGWLAATTRGDAVELVSA